MNCAFRKVLSVLLLAALLIGAPSAALADDGVTAPPPVVEEPPLAVDTPEDMAAPTESPVPEMASPEPTAEIVMPEQSAPEIVVPETMEPETMEPEIVESEITTPEVMGPEIVMEPEVAVPPMVDGLPEGMANEVLPPEENTYVDPMLEDPLYDRWMNRVSTVSLFGDSFERYTPRNLQAGETLRRGIDVSSYQGLIDWTKVAKSGVDFAIVRVGFRGTTEGDFFLDTYYKENLKGAHDAGLKVGAYFFSQAVTVEEAKEEAQYLLKIVKDYSIDLPLAFDYEETARSNRRLVMKDLDKQLMTDICNAFCQEVEAAGYQSMVYSNPTTLNNYLIRSQLGRLWLAHYIAQTNHASPYEFWQCGLGNVEGINGEVDINFWFEPDTVAVPPLNEEAVTPTPTPTPEPTPNVAVPPLNVKNPFKDVSKDNWFYDSVLWAYGMGVVNGTSEDSFGPMSTATRGQLVTMLYRLKGQPAVSGSVTFTDLKEDYYRNAVTWAATNGVVSGFSDTVFAPNNKVTREQLATMLYRMADSPEVTGDLSRFTDEAKVHDYAKDAMIWAVETGVVTGYTDNTVRPTASATRAEVCTMLSRFSAL